MCILVTKIKVGLPVSYLKNGRSSVQESREQTPFDDCVANPRVANQTDLNLTVCLLKSPL